MKYTEQRIAIAEACGWNHRDEATKVFTRSWLRPDKGDQNLYFLPDYLTDLNAMHEAEKVLTYNQKNEFEGILCSVIRTERGINPHTCAARASFTTYATAAQRAEAFLKTLNLWTR